MDWWSCVQLIGVREGFWLEFLAGLFLLPLTAVAGGGLGVSESDVSEERRAYRGFATFEKSFMYYL